MPALDDLKTTTKTLPEDNTKTQTTIESTENSNKNKPNMEVSAVTRSVEGDPSKSETLITSVSDSLVTVKVVGPFNGSKEVKSGTLLKDVLVDFNTEDDTYGKFKYRDEQDHPVALTHAIDRDTVVTSIRKG